MPAVGSRQNLPGKKVPTFVEVLHCLRDLKMGINVEIKPTEGKEIETAEKTMQLLKEHWPQELPLLVSSFYLPCLQKARELDSDVKIGIIIVAFTDMPDEAIEQLNCYSIHLNQKFMMKEIVDGLHAMDLKVLCHTVNELERAKELLSWGVDSIFTNYPDLLSA